MQKVVAKLQNILDTNTILIEIINFSMLNTQDQHTIPITTESNARVKYVQMV
jgi:hypothetical protein